MKDVSVIVPCYNKKQYLEACVRSIVNNQTDLTIEVIMVDDCSTDGSYEKCVELAECYECIAIQNPTNKKASAARNLGIQASSGDYIICLDGDDIIPNNYIQANYDNIIQNEVDISYNNSRCFGDINKEFNWPPFDIERLRRGPFIHCAAMFKRIVWETNKYDETFVYGSEDYDFWLSAAKSGFKFAKCNDTFLYYRVVDSGVTNTSNHENALLIRKMLKEKHGEFYLES